MNEFETKCEIKKKKYEQNKNVNKSYFSGMKKFQWKKFFIEKT